MQLQLDCKADARATPPQNPTRKFKRLQRAAGGGWRRRAAAAAAAAATAAATAAAAGCSQLGVELLDEAADTVQELWPVNPGPLAPLAGGAWPALRIASQSGGD